MILLLVKSFQRKNNHFFSFFFILNFWPLRLLSYLKETLAISVHNWSLSSASNNDKKFQCRGWDFFISNLFSIAFRIREFDKANINIISLTYEAFCSSLFPSPDRSCLVIMEFYQESISRLITRFYSKASLIIISFLSLSDCFDDREGPKTINQRLDHSHNHQRSDRRWSVNQ